MALGNLRPSEVQQYLEGVNYPADKDTVASTAESNGAPQELVDQIRGLGGDTFSGPDDVISALPLKDLGL